MNDQDKNTDSTDMDNKMEESPTSPDQNAENGNSNGEVLEAEIEPTLEDHLAEAQVQAADYLDGWQRARAELANFKRRVDSQRSEMIVSANTDLLERLLPVLDDLQLALINSPAAKDAGENPLDECKLWREWRDGVALIEHKFLTVLEGVKVVPIETEGLQFDPMVHEAVSYEEHPDMESGQIIAELRMGYMLGDRVLRASMVRVAR